MLRVPILLWRIGVVHAIPPNAIDRSLVDTVNVSFLQ
jgi:hypothetical protein